jgi:P4 family phage/plasmid primase-like protien
MTTIICTQTGEIASPTGPRIEAVIAATDAALDLGLSVYFEPYTGKALPRELPIFKDTKSITEANEKLGLERNRDRVEDLDNYRSGTTQRWVTALLKKRRELLNRDSTDRDKVRQLFDNLKWIGPKGRAHDYRDDMLLTLATGPKSGVLAIRVPARLYFGGVLENLALKYDKPPLKPTSSGDGYFNFVYKWPTGKDVPKNIKIKRVPASDDVPKTGDLLVFDNEEIDGEPSAADIEAALAAQKTRRAAWEAIDRALTGKLWTKAPDDEIQILGDGDMLLLPPTIGHWLDKNLNETTVVPEIPEMPLWLQIAFGIKQQMIYDEVAVDQGAYNKTADDQTADDQSEAAAPTPPDGKNSKPKKLPLHIKVADIQIKILRGPDKGLRVVLDIDGREHFWKYENGLWSLIADNEVVKWLEPQLQSLVNDLDKKERSNNKLFSEATKHIIRDPVIRSSNSFVNWDAHGKIPTKAGLIDPLTHELEPLSKQHNATWCLNIDYDPNAKCPWWEQTLADAFSDRTEEDRLTTINLLQDVAGMALLANRPKALSKALVLHGPPDCGKSVLLEVLSGLISPYPITSTFASLGGAHGLEPFLRRGVPWVLHEAFNDNVWHLSDNTKMIISGDPIQINPKNQKPITIKPTASPFWATNFEPKFKDSSGAMIIRMLIIKFTKIFVPGAPLIGAAAEASKRNPAWKPQHLILNSERSGLFNWALIGLKRALERGYFLNTKKGEEILEDVRLDSNIVAGFLKDCIDFDTNVMMSTVDFNETFKSWWKEKHGDEKSSPSPTLIGSHLASLSHPLIAQNKNRFKDRLGMRFYVGIKFNEAGQDFFNSKLTNVYNANEAIPRMSTSYADAIKPVKVEWLDDAEIIRIKNNAAAMMWEAIDRAATGILWTL